MKIKSSLGEETVDLMPQVKPGLRMKPDAEGYASMRPTGNDVVRHFNRVRGLGATGDVTCTLTAEEAETVNTTAPTKMQRISDTQQIKVDTSYPPGLKVVTAKE